MARMYLATGRISSAGAPLSPATRKAGGTSLDLACVPPKQDGSMDEDGAPASAVMESADLPSDTSASRDSGSSSCRRSLRAAGRRK